MISNKMFLAANRALLGAIGKDILAISLTLDEKILTLHVFSEGDIGEDEIEALDISTTEILADILSEVDNVFLMIHENSSNPVPRIGKYVFIRYGIVTFEEDLKA